MGFDDPVVIVMIISAAILLFGGSKIPELARSLGRAKAEFQKASSGIEVQEKK